MPKKLQNALGSKSWRFTYYFGGKQRRVGFGKYPEMSLKRARELTREAREHVAAGLDPADLKKAEKQAVLDAGRNSFEVVGRKWLAQKEKRWAPKTFSDQVRRFEQHLNPHLGARQMSELRAPELVRVLKIIESRGAETAKRCRILLQSIFAHALLTGRIEADATTALSKAIEPPRSKHYAAPTDPKEVGQILRMIDGYGGHPIVRAALCLHPLVFVRPGELRGARWEDIDFEKKEWKFTAPKTQTEVIVPLSRQALAILQEVKAHSFRASEWVFPSPLKMENQLSEVAMNAALRLMGIGPETLTSHGWRAVANTLGREECDFRPEWLEIQSAHKVRDPMGNTYNRAQWLPQRREMMQQWADYLDKLKTSLG